MTTASVTAATPAIASATSPNWLADAATQIQLASKPDGLLGALQNSKNANGSISRFLSNSISATNSFAAIVQGNSSDQASLTMRVAAAAYQKIFQERAALEQRLKQQNTYTPPQLLDSIIFFKDGSTFNTVKNIMTLPNGTQIDTITGAEVFDSESLIHMANGAYLNTETNILTLPDGTRIDIVTGLKITV
jgi:hypothetical protein